MTNDFAHKTDLVKIEGSLWKIRAAEASDAQALFEYLKQAAQEPVNNTRFRAAILPDNVEELREDIVGLRQRPNATIYVAVAGEKIVGVVFCRNGTHIFNQHSVGITIHVDSEYRNMGIGTNLMSAAIQWAILQPAVSRVELEVLTRNTKAIKLYERLGFKREGTMLRAYKLVDEESKGFVDSVLMAIYL